MKTQEFLQEDIVTDAAEMHTDHEVQMARSQCYHAAEDAIALHKLLRHISEAQGIEGWVAAKITLAADYLNKVREYLEYDLMSAQEPGEEMPVAESRHSNSMKEQDTTPGAAPAAQPFKFTPDQEKWLGGANRQDPNILRRMPDNLGPKPGVNYFKGADDQAIAKQVNVGRSNLNTVKGLVGMQKDAPEVFPTKPAATTAPAVASPAPQAAAQRPTVVGGPTTVSTRPDSVKPVSTQTLKVDEPVKAAPSVSTQQKPGERTTWQSLAKLNPNIKNPDRIYPGQEITLPNGTKAVVDKGDTLSSIAKRYRQGGYNDGTPVAPAAPTTAAKTPVVPVSTTTATKTPVAPAATTTATTPKVNTPKADTSRGPSISQQIKGKAGTRPQNRQATAPSPVPTGQFSASQIQSDPYYQQLRRQGIGGRQAYTQAYNRLLKARQ